MRKITKIYFFIILLFIAKNSFAQGYFNQWYFGNGAGLDFNTGSPVPISGNIHTIEGSTSISDVSGNLLFYTDGLNVWNANHAVMPNGTGLSGNSSSTQSALIVSDPGNADQYYIFTTPAGSGGFTYSIVDMTLASGLGDVTAAKNMILHPASTERATAVRMPNGTDFWIIGHEPENNVFFAYKLSATGLSPAPVLSYAGSIHSGQSNYIGYLKSSHKGDKLAIAIRYLDLFEVFDFNNSSGSISNAITFSTSYPYSYGVEFSPDDSRLYLSGGLGTGGYLYQADMNAGSNAAIISSSTLIANPVGGLSGALQIGPDCKIYVAKYATINLGVINDPDALGTLCNYVDNQIVLASGTFSQAGLPNFFEMKCCSDPGVYLGTDTTLCQGQMLTLNGGSATTCLWSTSSTDSSINVSASGIYWLQANNGLCSKRDSIDVTFNSAPVVNLQNDTILCQDQTISLNVSGATAYLWSTSSTDSSINVSASGNYWVEARNGQCSCRDSINVNFNSIPTVDLGNDTIICEGQPILLNVGNATSYLWSDGSSASSINVSASGTYWMRASNGQCSSSDSIAISVLNCETELELPNVFTPNSDGIYDNFIPIKYNRILEADLSVYNRWGEKVFYTNNLVIGWNGCYKDIICSEGTYYWIVQYTTITNESKTLTGFLSLIK